MQYYKLIIKMVMQIENSIKRETTIYLFSHLFDDGVSKKAKMSSFNFNRNIRIRFGATWQKFIVINKRQWIGCVFYLAANQL
jgi:hypothetical protein